MRAIKVQRVKKARTPYMVAVPARVTGSARVRRYFKEQEAALAYLIRVRKEGFLAVESAPSKKNGKSAPSENGNGAPTLGECAALWIARHEQYRASFFQVRQVMNRLIPRHGRHPIDQIGHQELDAWLRSLSARLSPTTVHNCWRITRRFFSFCQEFLEVIPRNPMRKLKEPRREREDPPILTPEQMRDCLEFARGNTPLTAYLTLGGFAGIRTEEIFRMPWDDIEWAAGNVYVRKPKKVPGWRPRYVDLLPALRRHLEPVALKGAAIDDAAKKHRLQNGRPSRNIIPGGQRTLYLARREMMNKLGWEKWPRNCLRHSFKSYHLAAFRDMQGLADQMGHSHTDMTRYTYGAPETRAAAAAWWAL